MNISPNKIKLYRAENGWSQEQLAEISGISLRTIQRGEKEGRCSQESSMALASAFSISPAELNDEFKNTIGDGTINLGGRYWCSDNLGAHCDYLTNKSKNGSLRAILRGL